MNTIRAVVHLSVRGYRSIPRSTPSRHLEPKQEKQMMKSMVDDNEAFDDVDAYESDFLNTPKAQKMHDR